MKVLFAVNDEKDAESITRMYQKEYKEIISSKTVYYYNAIIKELQKDKTYDRIVISEDLEMFSSDNYQAIDKFIFEKMDTISDEATNLDGSDIPIILLCMDRRTKNDPLLVKLFGLGIYNVLIGQDRSVQKVVDLIYKPRNKKEAKAYYKVEAEKVTYSADTSSDNGVNETEIQNILNHYKRIGGNPQKCVQSFDSITAQYSEDQVKLIIQTLPKSVRNILEDNSSSYRKIMGIRKKGTSALISDSQKDYVEKEIDLGSKLTQPVIIPTAVATKKISKSSAEQKNKDIIEQRRIREKAEAEARRKEEERKAKERAEAEARRKEEERKAKERAEAEARRKEEERKAKEKAAAEAKKKEEERKAKEKAAAEAKKKEEERKAKERAAAEAKRKEEERKAKEKAEAEAKKKEEKKNMKKNTEKKENQPEETTVKRGRGRPRKNPVEEIVLEDVPVKKKRGRPRKNPIEVEEKVVEEVENIKKSDEDNVVKAKKSTKKKDKKLEEDNEDILLDFDDFDDDVIDDTKEKESQNFDEDDDILPGFNDYDEDEIENSDDINEEDDEFDYDYDDVDEEDDDTLPGFDDYDDEEEVDEDEDISEDDDDFDYDYDDIDEEDDDTLPGFDDYDDEEEVDEDEDISEDDDDFDYDYDDVDEEDDDTLPGFDDYDDEEEVDENEDISEDDDDFDYDYDDVEEDDDTLPGFDDYDDEEEVDEDEDISEDDDDFDYDYDDIDEENDDDTLSGYDDYDEDENDDDTLPGFEDEDNDDISDNENDNTNEDDDTLPGFEGKEDSNDEFDYLDDENDELPGFDDDEEIVDFDAEEEERKQHDGSFKGINNRNYKYDDNLASSIKDLKETEEPASYNIDTDNLLTADQKIVSFVGTTKNGTSFIVNNLAELYSNKGIKTAVLDLTKNKNAYYIYTNNDDELREKAHNCLEKLKNGVADGVPVNKNLDVYTSLPSEDDSLDDVTNTIHTLLENYTIVLLDCDFETDVRYFKASQEIYLVQSLDVLTIQPLTAFLRELKLKNILDASKLRIVINKNIKVGSLNEKILIGGMSVYNDPGMTYMTDLFNRDTIKYVTIPFEDQVYVKYLEGLVNCKISSKGYSKSFIASLNKLGDMVYPTINGRKVKNNYNDYAKQNTFSNDTNSILDKMKKKY